MNKKQKMQEKNREKKYYFSTNWFEPHIENWKKVLLPFKNKKINILEIGVFEGRSTVWMIEEMLNDLESRLWAVDTFKEFWRKEGGEKHNHEKVFRENIVKTGKEKQVEIVKKKSQLALDELNSKGKEKFDFIYIDGDHKAQEVLSDAVRAFNLLKEGGIMIFDDYEWDYYEEEYNNPRIAIDAFLKCYERQVKVLFKHYQVAIKKARKKIKETARKDKRII